MNTLDIIEEEEDVISVEMRIGEYQELNGEALVKNFKNRLIQRMMEAQD